MAGPVPASTIVQSERTRERATTDAARATAKRLGEDLPSRHVKPPQAPEARPVTLAPARPRALDESYDPRLLTTPEVEQEISLIRDWLAAQRESGPEQQRLTRVLIQLDGQLRARLINIGQAEAQLLTIAREKPKTVDQAIQRLRLARGWATREPPAYDDVLVIIENVLAFLLALKEPINFDNHFALNRNITTAHILTDSAIGFVRERTTFVRLYHRDEKLKKTPMRLPLWDLALGAVQAGREYFLILNNELALKDSTLAQAVDQAVLLGTGAVLVLTALPIVTAIAVEAAPLLIGVARIALVVFRGVIVRALTIYVSNPVRTVFLSEFAVETALDVMASGGVREYFNSMRDPANLLPRVLNVFVIGIHLAPRNATGRAPTLPPSSVRRTSVAVEVEVVEITDQGAKVRVRNPAHEIREEEIDLLNITDDEPLVVERFKDVQESTRDVRSRKVKGLEPSGKGPKQQIGEVSERTRARKQRESLDHLSKARIETTAVEPVHRNVGRSNRSVADRLTRAKQLEGVDKEYLAPGRGDENARKNYAKDVLQRILAKKDHILSFLVEERVDPKTGETVKDWRKTPQVQKDGSIKYKRIPGNEKGVTIQVGHPVTRARGGADVFMLEDADLNQATNRTVETRGGTAAKPFVILNGEFVDLVSAMLWECLGLLPSGTVARAPVVVPELPPR